MPRPSRRAPKGGEKLVPLSLRTRRETKEKFRGAAQAAGMSLSEILDEFLENHRLEVRVDEGALSVDELRARALELARLNAAKAAKPVPSAEKRRLLYLVSATSNNANQLAHQINADRLAGRITERTYELLLIDLDAILATLRLNLARVD